VSILSALKSVIRFEFRYQSGKTVAGITASLQQTVKDLEDLAAERIKLALEAEEAIAAAAKARAEHLDEQLKASTVAAKIGALLG
jgi:hypothetical protein